MNKVRSFIERDQFAKHCGVQLVDVRPGYAKATVQLTQSHCNGVETAHGGLLFTLADFAFAAACNAHGQVTVAISATIHFVRAATQGTLVAIAEKDSEPARVSTYHVTIRDDSDQVVASFQGLAYHKKMSLPLE